MLAYDSDARSEKRGKRQEAASEKRQPSGMDIKDVTVGMEVEIVSSGFKGSVTSLPDDKGNLSVLCGIINYKTNVSDLIPVADEQKKDRKDPGTGKRMSLSHARTISTELNIIGCTVDEGIARLEKYLDDAMMSGLEIVRIVHGKGTGALRKGIHDYLRRQSYIKSYKLAELGEGDSGVTVVTFR